MRFGRRLGLCLLLLVAPASVAGQGTAASPFAIMGLQRLRELARDSAVVRASGATDAGGLMAWLPRDALGRLSDADLIGFMELYARSLSHARAATCAAAWTMGTSAGFVPLATEMDSTLAVEWVALLEKWVWAAVRRQPIGHRAAGAEVHAAMLEVAANVAPEDRARAQRVLLGESTDEAEICAFITTALRWFASLPPDRAAPLIRTLMFGPTSES